MKEIVPEFVHRPVVDVTTGMERPVGPPCTGMIRMFVDSRSAKAMCACGWVGAFPSTRGRLVKQFWSERLKRWVEV